MAKGHARGGVIAALAAVLVLVAGVAVGWLWRPLGVPEASPTPTPTEEPSIFAAAAGTCVAEFEDAWQLEYDFVDCAAAHAAEVLGTVDATEYVNVAATAAPSASPAAPSAGASASTGASSWPGDDALADWAVLACEGLDAYDPDEVTELQVRWPLQADWDAGERNYVCFAVTPELATASPTPMDSPAPSSTP